MRNKIGMLVILTGLLLFGFMSQSLAGDVVNFTFDTTSGEIIEYVGPSPTVIIPATINGVTVNSIGASAFSNRDDVTSVQIPATITQIKEEAFAGTEISAINLPNGLQMIGERAFFECSELREIIVPESVTIIGGGAFEDSGLTEAVLPTRLQVIEHDLFRGCGKITDITIPRALTRIGEYAFCGTGLESIYIPETVAVVENNAFESCDYLSIVTIAGTNTKLDPESFFFVGESDDPLYFNFLCDAPALEDIKSVMENSFRNVVITYANEKAGWSTPTWYGFKTIPTYLVSYYNGTELFDEIRYLKDSPIGSSLLPTLSKEGYEFGWAEAPNGSAVDINTWTPQSNTALYAVWTLASYDIKYQLDGGTIPAGQIDSYTSEDEIILPKPTKSNHTFVGWYPSSDFTGEAVESIPKGSVGYKTFWAKWKAESITIKFINGTTTYTRKVGYGAKIVAPAPTKTGYALAGWYTDKNGKGTKLSTKTTAVKATTYYAYWISHSPSAFKKSFSVTNDYGYGSHETWTPNIHLSKPRIGTIELQWTKPTYGGTFVLKKLIPDPEFDWGWKKVGSGKASVLSNTIRFKYTSSSRLPVKNGRLYYYRTQVRYSEGTPMTGTLKLYLSKADYMNKKTYKTMYFVLAD